MRLLPAFIVIIVLFLIATLFLQGRRVSGRLRNLPVLPSGTTASPPAFLITGILIALAGLLFIFLGKLAVLLAVLTFALYFLTSKRR